ncbi:MAG: 4-(cytidine 5'-diphospho)-2-C-methyl-D-erythritol kinase [Alistipes sp.]|nr:4-(cytidine 5'-diphospho)-2-C-methyl-D-erythritol kinase [Alistipes sp.]
MKLRANCKINIGLDVLAKRADGYHDLQSVMIPVKGLFDEIEMVKIEGDEPQFYAKGIALDCEPEDNICLKAWRLMHERYGVGAVSIVLDKYIPFGAGLGGGSSDATTILMGLNEMFELGLSEEELISLASELGSDTAFFVRNSPQLCEGRGEIMTPVKLDLDYKWLVLVKPEANVSTREAYAGVKPAVPEVPLAERLQRPVDEWQECVKNDFEPSVFDAHPAIAKAKADLIEAGAVYASMSGSGSVVYGIFEDRGRAEMMLNQTPYLFML